MENSAYETSEPDSYVVQQINALRQEGHRVLIMTARGCRSGIDHTELTKFQLNQWGVGYDELIMDKKPYADIFIDDRAVNINDWKLMRRSR